MLTRTETKDSDIVRPDRSSALHWPTGCLRNERVEAAEYQHERGGEGGFYFIDLSHQLAWLLNLRKINIAINNFL